MAVGRSGKARRVDLEPDRRSLLSLAAVAAFAGGAKAAPRCSIPAAPLTTYPPAPPLAGKQAVVRANGAALWVCDTGGTGLPIILLHPFTGSGHVWGYQQQAFVAAGWRVISYSRRGYRGSDPIGAGGAGTDAADLAALLDVLTVAKCHLVASAGGGFVAADFAVAQPHRAASLTIACSILGAKGGEFDRLQRALADPAIAALPAYLRELSPSYRATNPDGVRAWRDLSDSAHVGGRPPPPSAGITRERLAALSMPRLLIGGDADMIAPPPFLRLFAGWMAGSRLRILPEGGHSLYWERPDLFNAEVLDFLPRHG